MSDTNENWITDLVCGLLFVAWIGLFWGVLLPWENSGWKFDLYPAWFFVIQFLVCSLLVAAVFAAFTSSGEVGGEGAER